MANIKYADPTYTDIPPTDDDKVMFRTGAGGDARGSIVQPKGYIDGLKLEWVSGTQVRVTPGAAYVPGPKRIAELASAVTLTPTLAANTWYHSYLTVSVSTVGVEAVTAAPAAPYTGTARTKTGDTSRRYIGSFRTNASSQIMRFTHTPVSGDFRWGELPSAAPLRILTAGSATVSTDVSTAGCAPITVAAIFTRVIQNGATGIVYIGSPVDGTAVSISNYTVSLEATKELYTFLPVINQTVKYIFNSAPASSGAFLDVLGFQYER
ncbi:MAG: hypothetical protein ACREOX_06985 [Stenotrophomonas sp.]